VPAGYVCHPLGLRIITKLLDEINWFDTALKIDLDDLITQAEAAELRGVSIQAINHLVKKGRFRVVRIVGRVLLYRDEVMNYTPSVGGRPKKSDSQKKSRKPKRKA